MNHLLQVKNLTKKFQGQSTPAIDNISFNLEQGKILSIIGENGSGKTTLIKMLHGLLDADQGEILFNNEKVKGPSEVLVAGHPGTRMLTQNFKLFPHHKIKDNILYNLRMHSDSYQNERLQELLSVFDLQGKESKTPAELSGGEQQRAALAAAIAQTPSLLLMDEPFSNLDIIHKESLRKSLIHQLREDGVTVIFITHDIKEALAFSDEVMVLRKGKIEQRATPVSLYRKPANTYTGLFLGDLNIFPLSDFRKAIPKFILPDPNTKPYSHITLRPEDIRLCKEETSIATGKIKRLYFTGNFYEVECEAKNLTIKIFTRKANLQVGQKIYFRFSKSRVHFLND